MLTKITIHLITILLIINNASFQPINGTMTINLSNYVVQSSSDYTFSLVFYYNDPFVVGSIIKINFPNSYASNSTTNYGCSLTNWPFAVSTSVTCSITNRILSIIGAFPQQFQINQEITFQFVVRGITNPSFAGSTPSFYGVVVKPDLTQIVAISQQRVSIQTGSLTAQLIVQPSIVSTISDLKVTVTTSHPLPAYAQLQFYIASNTWDRANSISAENILYNSPSCQAVNNAPSNLFCITNNTLNQRIIFVSNINNNIDSPTSGPVTFIFNISRIQTPPTTQPQGSFSLTVLDQNSKSVDASLNNKISVMSPQQIMSPTLWLSTYVVSQLAIAIISFSINTILDTTDSINIKIPPEISLANLQSIFAGTQQITRYSINNNTITLSGVSIINSLPMIINLTQIVNPSYVADVTSNNTSTFSIWTLRNGYKMNEIENPFTYTTVSGDINSSISALSSQAGVVTTYTINITFQHNINKDSSLQILFPSDTFSINMGDNLIRACASNLSPVCNLVLLSNNLIKLTHIISSNDNNVYQNIVITLQNITNPLKIGIFNNLKISSYNINSFLVDREGNVIGFGIIARQLSPARISITSTIHTVYANTQITLLINTNNPITPSSHLILYIPLQLDVAGMFCTPFCNYLSTSTHYIYQIGISQFFNSSASSIITIVLSNIRNPKSTKPTDSFQIHIYNSVTSQLLETIISGLSYRECNLSSTLSVSLTRNSSMNSDNYVQYDFSLGLAFSYTDPVVVQISLPNLIPCLACISINYNSSYYSTIVSTNSSGRQLNFSLIQPVIISILLINHFSFQAQYLSFILFTNDQSYQIASKNNLQVTNNLQNSILLTYRFTPLNLQQLKQSTTLSVTNMIVKYGGFNYILIQFGNQFDVSGALLASGGNSYNLSIISNNLLKLVKKSTASSSINVDTFSISNIITPGYTPNSETYIQTFTQNNFIVDKTQSYLVWQTSCILPCRQCWPNSSTTCNSCYSNGLLVMSKTLFFSNGINSTCLTQCPSLYYLEASNNTCQHCSSICANCALYNICTSCPVNFPYILTLNSSSSTCYLTCPSKYYPSNATFSYRCLDCDPLRNCQTCSNYQTCNSCIPTYYYFLQQCIQTCPNLTTVANQYTWICQYCPTNCSTCIRDTSINGSFVIKCIACESGFLLDNDRCYTTCVTFGLVPDPITNTCSTCSPACLTCSGSMSNCTTCNTSSIYRYFHNNNCVTSCYNGYYNDSYSNSCVRCSPPCQYCTSSSISSCLSCTLNYTLYVNVCRNLCPTGYYQNGSNCLPCLSICASCISSSICNGCNDGYVLVANTQCQPACPDGYYPTNRICYQCSNNCKTCSLVNFCTSCFPSMYLYQGQCVDPCPPKYYKNSLNMTCLSCPYQCAQCLSNFVCLSCINGYELVTNNVNVNVTCNSTCLAGYVPIDGVCQLCSFGCNQCVYLQNNCTNCINEYYSYQSIIATNSTSSYMKYCYQSCPLTLYTYQTSYQCLSLCPASTYPNITYNSTNSSIILQKQCINCPSLCLTCSSSQICLSCVSGSSAFNNSCYSPCPPAAPYSVNNVCKQCNVVQCYQCSGTLCVQCNYNYLLITTDGVNSCISSCGNNMIYNISVRQCQILNNSTSSSNSSTTGNNTTTATTTNTVIKFVPLPFIIGAVIFVLIIFALHWTQFVQIYGSFFGLFGVFLQLSTATTLGVLVDYVITQINNSTTSSDNSTSVSSKLHATLSTASTIIFGSQISHKVLLMLGVITVVMILINVICTIVYFCQVRIKRYRIVSILAMIFGCKLIGALLCSEYYGINMKKFQQSDKKQSNIKEEDNLEKAQKETILDVQPYVNRGKSYYAKTLTRNFSNSRQIDFNQYKGKLNKSKKVSNRSQRKDEHIYKQGSNQLSKVNSKNIENSIKQNTNNIFQSNQQQKQQIQKYQQKQEKEFKQQNQHKQQKKEIIVQIQQIQIKSSKKNSKITFKNQNQSIKKTFNNKNIQPINNSKKSQISKKKQSDNLHRNSSQSINSSSYKPSQLHSLPNPKLSIKLQSPFNQQNQIKMQSQIISQKQEQIVNQSLNQHLNINSHQHSIQEIKKQYLKFWQFYDCIILIHIPMDIVLITCGILLCFNFQYYYFQFFAGIQLVVLGVLDLMMTGLWRLWNHQSSNNYQLIEHISRNKNRNKYRNKYQSSKKSKLDQSQSIISALSKQKLYGQDQQSINNNNTQEPNQYKQDYQIQYFQQDIKQTKTEFDNLKITDKNIQKQQKDKDYKSQFARPLDVLKLKNQQIQQAIDKGIYRQNKKQLAQKQYKEDQQSKLDSAQKFNKVSRQQQITQNPSIDQQDQKTKNQKSNNQKTNKLTGYQQSSNKLTTNKQISKKLTQNQQKTNKISQSNKLNIQQPYMNNQQENQQIDDYQQKQVKQIIFENNDEQSLDTHIEQNDEDNSLDKNQSKVKKRKDSLGSEKDVVKDMRLSKIQNDNKNLQPKKVLQIQDYGNNQAPKNKLKQDFDTKTGQFSPNISKQFTNIFENQLIQEDQNNQELNSQLQIEPISIKNVYKKAKQQKINPNSKLPLQIFEKASNRVIYADLDSVGTVSQYDIQNEKNYEDRYKSLQYENKIVYKNQYDPIEDQARPSNFIDTNFVYHNKRSIDNALPQKLNISRPKKVSKKQTNNNNNNKLIN